MGFGSSANDAQLGATGVGDQRVRRGVLDDFGQQVQRGADGQ